MLRTWHRAHGNGNGHGTGNGGPREEGAVAHHAHPRADAEFVRHLRQHVGRQVTLQTATGMLHGRLAEVFPDHVLLRMDGREHHVRIAAIVWFSPNGNGNGTR